MSNPVDLALTLIGRELDAVFSFIDILNREAEVLAAGPDHNVLADVVQTKWFRAKSLDAIHLERVALLDSMGIKEGKIDTLTSSNPEIKSLWDQLIPATKQAKELNEANGVMINVFLKSTEEAMKVLRAASGNSDVYGANGRTTVSGVRVLATT